MIVQCPECKTTYNLDDERIAPEGSNVRCSRCQHVFEVSRMPGPFPEDTMDQLTGMESSASDELEPEEEHSPGTPGELPGKKDEAGDRIGKIAGKKKSMVLWALLTFVLLAGVGVAAYVFAPTLLNNTGTPTPVEKRVGEQPRSEEGIIPEISLENVHPYFVRNEKVGRIFVVEGKAVNGFKVSKELIKLRIRLFDSAGTVIASRDFYCGNVVSSFQLQVLGQDELQSALSAKVGILTNNANIKPGAGVPFMVAFANPPESLQEFALEAVEIKDVPADT